MDKLMRKLRRNSGSSSQTRPTVTLTPAANTVDRCFAYYAMNHENRGKAIIFAHSKFELQNEKVEPRKGNEVDCKILMESLETLGFDVNLYKDKRWEDMSKILEKVSSMDHSNSDCLLVAVLTHGEENDVLLARNCRYTMSALWTPFTGEKCQTLAGKPKIFIVQACQGSKVDAGVKIEKDGLARYSIPRNADFLFAFATIPNYVAFRNKTEGSWFIRELCSELNENGQRYDMLTLLTFVVQKVAHNYESFAPKYPEIHMKKQTPCIVSMLTRLLLFNNI